MVGCVADEDSVGTNMSVTVADEVAVGNTLATVATDHGDVVHRVFRGVQVNLAVCKTPVPVGWPCFVFLFKKKDRKHVKKISTRRLILNY